MAVFNGTAGNDNTRGTNGDDQMFGLEGNDVLFGDAGQDRIFGGSGDDTLDGGQGADWLSGGEGRDVLIGGAGADMLDGGAGVDVVRLSGKRTDYLIIGSGASGFVIDLRVGMNFDGLDLFRNVERLYFAGDNTTTYLVANNSPVASNDVGSGAENSATPILGNVLVNDSDADLDPLSVSALRTGPQGGSSTGGTVGSATAGQYGSLILNANGSYSYVADNNNVIVNALTAGQSLTDFFTYTVADGQGGTSQATLTITVNGGNDAPVAVDDAVTATEDTPYTSTVSLIANDTDVDGPSKTAVAGAFTTAQGGSLVLAADGSYTYTAAANFAGTDTVDYTVTDGTLSDTGTLTITVKAVNDPPVIGGQTTGAVTEDSSTSTSGTLTITDPDSNESSFQAQTGLQGTYGTLNINEAGNWTYFLNNLLSAVQALDTGETLSDTVSVLAADGTTQAIGITINGQDEANGFFGKQLTYQYLFPNLSTTAGSAYAFTTSEGIEVPANSSAFNSNYFQIDVSANEIVVTYLQNAKASSAAFNGFKLTDVVNNIPTITGVSDNSAKAATSYDANNVYVNWQNQSFTAGEVIIIGVMFGIV